MDLKNHLEKLNYFYAIAKSGSMKRAAEEIFITQPSLTKSIKILEEVVSAPLFNRNPKGVTLTTEGEILIQFCHSFFGALSDVEQKLKHPTEDFAGKLRIGTYDSIGVYFWPKFLKTFLSNYPLIDLELSTGRSIEMQKKLENNELDLILVIEPKASSKIKTIILNSDSFKLYESTKPKKTYQDFKEAPLILMPSAVAGPNNLEEALHSYGLGERKLYKTSSLESAKELIINGIGIGLLPQLVAKPPLKRSLIEQVSLKGIPKSGIGEHSIGAAFHKDKMNSLVLKELIKNLQDIVW